MGGLGGGTVTSVGISGTSPISASGTVTSTGTLSVSHENSGVTAQNTQALYPFKVNATGHITSVGTAATIPTKVSDLTNDSGYITGISSSDVTTALGYTPAGKMIISRGTEITTGTYSINVSYSDIVSALAQGINPVFSDPDYTYAFVGYFVDMSIPFLVFGESVIVNGQATTQGYLIPVGTSTATWASQVQTIPTDTSDLNNDAGFVSAIIRTWSDS